MFNYLKPSGIQADETRYPIIDYIRVFAIFLMVVFHLAWDLNIFKFVSINFQKDPFWFWLPRFIVTLFLISMGMSMAIVYRSKIDSKKVWKRVAKIGIFAILISGFTYFAFPRNWIYFGTLHCIAICSILALPFLRTPKLNLILAVLFPVLYWILKIRFVPWSKSLKIVSMDYIPLHPWLGMVLLGIAMSHFEIHKLLLTHKPPKWILWCSKHSLEIYLIHQGLLYGLVYLLYMTLRNF